MNYQKNIMKFGKRREFDSKPIMEVFTTKKYQKKTLNTFTNP